MKGHYTNHEGSYNCTSCLKGKHQSSIGQSSCVDCLVGTYSNHVSAIECDNCEVGKIAPNINSTHCQDCESGKYQLFIGQYKCLQCAAGFYTNTTGAIYCSECPYSYYSVRGQSECSIADVGFYIDETGYSSECPHHTTCRGKGGRGLICKEDKFLYELLYNMPHNMPPFLHTHARFLLFILPFFFCTILKLRTGFIHPLSVCSVLCICSCALLLIFVCVYYCYSLYVQKKVEYMPQSLIVGIG